jgi:hypothetical protein
MIIDVLPIRSGAIGQRPAPVLQDPVRLRRFAGAGQAQAPLQEFRTDLHPPNVWI